MMIRVPVVPVDQEELMALISWRSSACVLKGEKDRMSCRLTLCSSLTLSKLKLRTTCNQTWTNGKKNAW